MAANLTLISTALNFANTYVFLILIWCFPLNIFLGAERASSCYCFESKEVWWVVFLGAGRRFWFFGDVSHVMWLWAVECILGRLGPESMSPFVLKKYLFCCQNSTVIYTIFSNFTAWLYFMLQGKKKFKIKNVFAAHCKHGSRYPAKESKPLYLTCHNDRRK